MLRCKRTDSSLTACMHCLKLKLTCMHALLQTQTDFHCEGFGYRDSDHTCHLYADASNCASGTQQNGVDNDGEAFDGSANDSLNWYTCRPVPCTTQAALPDSLVGYWPLDGSGADISGHGLAAADLNGEYTAGLYGQVRPSLPNRLLVHRRCHRCRTAAPNCCSS